MKFFGPPTTKWWPCKIFAKLNGNYLLMANIFKLHKYKIFGLMKMHNICKIWFAKVWFTINGPSKMLFFNFCLFIFSKFQMTIVKNLKCISRVLSNFYFVTNIFDLHIFEKETVTLLIFFEICTDMHFVSLFFLNERNITTSLLMIHLKCTVVHYANLNSSSINKPFLNYGLLNILFRLFFLYFLFVFVLMKLLSKMSEITIIFNANF